MIKPTDGADGSTGPHPLSLQPWRPRKVLVVDDAPIVTQALTKILGAEGYHVIPCLTMAEALGWMERRGAIDRPAAVIVDIHLPDGSGLDLARRTKELLGDVPVLVISGDTSIENLRALPDSGATLFLAKPVHVPSLIGQIRMMVDLPSAEVDGAAVSAP